MTDDYPPLPKLLLSQVAVDRVAHRRSDEEWLSKQWSSPDSRVLVVCSGSVPVKSARKGNTVELFWRTPAQAPQGERYLLGVAADGCARFAVSVEELPAGESTGDLRQLASTLPDSETALLVHAIALDNWHAAHRFCPRCGGPTAVAVAGAERRCTLDGSAHFPRTDPAVIVLVTDPAGRALLGRQSAWPEGRFSTLAGFVEPGESAEHAVAREIAEESGVIVTDIRYVGSQPWPFPASLMLGFVARAAAQEPVPDGVELEQVRWFSRSDIETAIERGELLAPSGISIARRLIERWYGGPLPEGPSGSTWR